jgi:O-antigen ligase
MFRESKSDRLIFSLCVLVLAGFTFGICIAFESRLLFYLSLLIAIVVISLIKYDIGVGITLFLIPYAWSLGTVGFWNLIDQKSSYVLFYILFFATCINTSLKRLRCPIRNNPLFWPFLGILSVNLISLGISSNIAWSAKEYVKLLYLTGVYVVVFNYVRYRGKHELLANVLLWSTLSVAILGLLQYVSDVTILTPVRVDIYGWNHIEVTPYYFDLSILSEGGIWLKRIGAVYVGSPNLEANFLITGFFLSLVGLIYKWGNKVICCMSFIVISVAIILTYSRGAWLGIIVAGCVLFIYLSKGRKIKGLGVFVFAGFIFVPLGALIMERVSGFWGEGSVASHISMWQAAFGAIRENPIMGKGLGMFKLGDIGLQYALRYAERPDILEGWLDRRNILVHNFFLQAWVETGGIGLIALLVLVYMYLRTVWSYIRNAVAPNKGKSICLAFFLCTIAMLVQNLTINHFGVEIWIPIGISLGIVARSKDNLRVHNDVSCFNRA